MMKHKYDAFLSYDRRDRDNVTILANILQNAGLKVWLASWGEWGMGDVDEWFSATSIALDESSNLLILIGSHGIESYPVDNREIARPFERTVWSNYRIIPVLLPGGQSTAMPMFLRTRVYCDLREWNKTHLSKLIEILRPAPRVFLCHAKEDGEKIERLFHYLEARRVDPWYDKKKLKVGDVWREEIFQAIEETDFFAVCLSSTAVRKKGFIQNEIRTAIQEYQRRPFGSKYLLPLKLDRCEVPRIRLDSQMLMSDLQWLEVFDCEAEAFKNLADDIWKIWQERQ